MPGVCWKDIWRVLVTTNTVPVPLTTTALPDMLPPSTPMFKLAVQTTPDPRTDMVLLLPYCWPVPVPWPPTAMVPLLLQIEPLPTIVTELLQK